MTALLIGFCQELGIRTVLTTEVIGWAQRRRPRGRPGGAAHALRAATQGTPPKHVDGRLVTVKDDDLRPYAEAELRELHAQVTDPNFRIFADGEWIYVFNARAFRQGTDFNEIFDQLGVDEPTHAFYLGKELMKATIARALKQELPAGSAARLGLSHVRRAPARARQADDRPAREVVTSVTRR